MGRKVHPIGFRLGIIKNHVSRWYAEGDAYPRLLAEDRLVRSVISEDAGQAMISKIEIERFPSQIWIWVHSARPGVIIGRKGATIKALRQRLQQLTGKRVKIEVEEISRPDLDSRLVAVNIAEQLGRRISHKRAMKRAITRAMSAGAEGMMITCAGRLMGNEMARSETVREGRVPRHTLRADIDYAQAEAATTFGRIGIKVWIYKGEILPEKAVQPPVV
ncbi:MAG TPA: 30S ribosomal protein S3 [Anaerolineae bacterium]|nr:30S ribosomal protein S3 [Anaerolineae bacterium]